VLKNSIFLICSTAPTRANVWIIMPMSARSHKPVQKRNFRASSMSSKMISFLFLLAAIGNP
jgi:hypothetical protein